jgi:phage portal protein BeeE
MGLMNLFRREPKAETRAAGSGFTAEIMAAREAWVGGRRGLAELTGTVQACVSLWEGALSLVDVAGTDLLDRRSLALCARSLALRGEWVAIIGERGLVPVSDWDLSTRDGRPRAYRLSIPEAGGGRSETRLAGEVLHVVLAADPAAPWSGLSPLRRASLSAGLLHAVETALAETFELAPIGSQVVPMPENPAVDNAQLGRSFRGQRGRVLLRESVSVTAAGGPVPASDWRPASLSPDIKSTMAVETLAAAQEAVLAAFGVLPGLFNPSTTGPLVREAQRHLAGWTLQPIAELIAEEASRKLGVEVALDVHRPLQSFDQGGSARAVATLVEALARAKETGLSDASVAAAFGALDWKEALRPAS